MDHHGVEVLMQVLRAGFGKAGRMTTWGRPSLVSVGVVGRVASAGARRVVFAIACRGDRGPGTTRCARVCERKGLGEAIVLSNV